MRVYSNDACTWSGAYGTKMQRGGRSRGEGETGDGVHNSRARNRSIPRHLRLLMNTKQTRLTSVTYGALLRSWSSFFFDDNDASPFSLRRKKAAGLLMRDGHRGSLTSSHPPLPQLLGAKKQRECRRKVSRIREDQGENRREAAAFPAP